jgi:mono/diheme cytochrome c family protein
MKVLLKTTLASALFTTLAFSQTTMCFKENHTNLTTLETVKLDGGECQSKLSLTDMKANGWEVDDIKINNNNYIYILKKGSVSTTVNSSNINMEDLEAKVLAKMEAKRKIEKEQKEKIQKEENASNGKKIYTNKCQNCHGAKGELEPGFSAVIANLSKDDFQGSIDGYRNGSYNNGTSIQMTAYALAISDEDINNIYDYIQSVK